jgi:nicotinamidase-related amidase
MRQQVSRPWEQFLPSEEIEVYRRAGYLKPVGFGDRPAVLVVDVEYNYTGDRPEPILESIAKFRNSCGQHAWRSIPHIRRLLEVARSRGVPVIYTRGLTGANQTEHERRIGREIVQEISPQRDDVLIEKAGTSAFFGTHLVQILVQARVDTLLVCGCTTSGCVRATVVDSHDFGFRTIVVEECVFDRAMTPHQVNLFDMAAKYADVVPLDEVLSHFERT